MGGMVSLESVALVCTPMLQSRVRKDLAGLAQCAGADAWTIRVFADLRSVLLAVCAARLGGGWTDSNANSFFVDLHGKNSPKYLGMLHGCFGIGGLLTPLLIGAILTAYPWRTAYVTGSGIFGVVVLVFIAAILPSTGKV